jgi:hypothetical protein
MAARTATTSPRPTSRTSRGSLPVNIVLLDRPSVRPRLLILGGRPTLSQRFVSEGWLTARLESSSRVASAGSRGAVRHALRQCARLLSQPSFDLVGSPAGALSSVPPFPRLFTYRTSALPHTAAPKLPLPPPFFS